VLAGSKPGDLVLDPFNGSGTTGVVAMENGRHYVGCELNEEYVEIYKTRLGEAKRGYNLTQGILDE
jgi:DNA modification methylase